MPQWQALSRTAHRDKGLLPRDGYHHAVSDTLVPVLINELPKLLPHYALGFVTRGEGFAPVALLSLDGQRNAYVAPDGKWIGSYVPALIRGYPFALADGEDDHKILAIDTEHLSDEGGEPLFEGDEPGDTVKRTLEFLRQCDTRRQQTDAATDALQQAGVITDWPLKLQRPDDEEPRAVQGLYRIDETALNALDPETLATLQGGPLGLAYAQLFSMSQLDQLTQRDKHLGERAKVAGDLDSFFGEEDDDLTFDFG